MQSICTLCSQNINSFNDFESSSFSTGSVQVSVWRISARVRDAGRITARNYLQQLSVVLQQQHFMSLQHWASLEQQSVPLQQQSASTNTI